jgi:hypothetical protein
VEVDAEAEADAVEAVAGDVAGCGEGVVAEAVVVSAVADLPTSKLAGTVLSKLCPMVEDAELGG